MGWQHVNNVVRNSSCNQVAMLAKQPHAHSLLLPRCLAHSILFTSCSSRCLIHSARHTTTKCMCHRAVGVASDSPCPICPMPAANVQSLRFYSLCCVALYGMHATVPGKQAYAYACMQRSHHATHACRRSACSSLSFSRVAATASSSILRSKYM